jgi:hypothetical protein
MPQTTMQAVVTPLEQMTADRTRLKIALFNPDGTPFDPSDAGESFTPAAAVPDSEATTILGLVSDFNGLLASLRAAGILAE